MELKHLLATLIFCICSAQMYGQFDAQVSQYWQVKTYYNPSFAGETNMLQASALYKHQWVGITRAPKTFAVAANMPLSFLGRVHGVGAMMTTESIGLYNNKFFSGQYTYKKKFKKNTLNIGVQAGFASIGFDASKIEVYSDEDDDAIPSGGDQSTKFDAAIGASWVAPDYYVGLSMTHAMQPVFELEAKAGGKVASYIPRAYYFMAGYNIQLRNSLYELQPSVLVKSDAILTQYDLTARLVYNKMFKGGLSWRKDDGFIFLLGFTYKGIDAGYAYDLSTSAINQVSSGSHEISLRYSMPIKPAKGTKNRYKSIRIL